MTEEPIENEEATVNEVLIAKAPSGKLVAIPYNHDPPRFDNEFTRSEHDEKEAIKVLGFKEKIESGALPPDTGIDIQVIQKLSYLCCLTHTCCMLCMSFSV